LKAHYGKEEGKRLYNEMDTNHDGVVSKEEWDAAHNDGGALHEGLTAEDEAEVSRQLEEARAKAEAKGQPFDAEAEEKKLREEASKEAKAAHDEFNQIDADASGELTKEEFEEKFGKKKGDEMFESMDVNHDGSVSRAEFEAGMRKENKLKHQLKEFGNPRTAAPQIKIEKFVPYKQTTRVDTEKEFADYHTLEFDVGGVVLTDQQIEIAKGIFQALGSGSPLDKDVVCADLPGTDEEYAKPPAFKDAVDRHFGKTRQQQVANSLAYGGTKEAEKSRKSNTALAIHKDRAATDWLNQLFKIGDGKIDQERWIDFFTKLRQEFGNKGLMIYVRQLEKTMKANGKGSTSYSKICY